MRTPTIHLNGSPANALEDDLIAALDALRKAREALHIAGPNARDYYPQGSEAWPEVAREHLARDQKLATVERELCEMLDAVQAQIDAREARG